MNIARVQNGTVVNIEVVSDDWLATNDAPDGVVFVPYTDDNPAVIGLGWNEVNGFEQAPTVPFPPGFDPTADPTKQTA